MADFRFTLETIKKLPPRGGIYAVWDRQVPGFGCRVYPGGTRKYVVRLRFVGEDGRKRERLHTVGNILDYERVEDARSAALEVRRRYMRGEDVKATTQRTAVEATTVREWLELWLQQRKEAGKHKPRTAEDARQAAEAGWYGWLDKPLQDITPEALLRRHAQRSRKAKTRANLEARYLRALWRWVAARHPELKLGPPPTDLLNETRDWNPQHRKTRRIETADLPAWFEAVRSLKNTRDACLFELLAFTGLRGGEARELQWKHIDLQRGTLHLPNPKNGRATTLPLSRQALTVMKRLATVTGESRLCFPALSHEGLEVPMPNPSKAVQAVAKAAGFKWGPHDLRRGFLSIGGALRIHPTTLRHLTNHATQTADAHAGYFQPELAELRAASQDIADRIDAAVTGATVVQFPKGRTA